MTKKVLALLALAVVFSACETTETEPTATSKPTPVAQSPTPAIVPSPEPTLSASAPIKVGDKVKAADGSFANATVISIDDKTAKAAVKIEGQKETKSVALSELVKQ